MFFGQSILLRIQRSRLIDTIKTTASAPITPVNLVAEKMVTKKLNVLVYSGMFNKPVNTCPCLGLY